MTMNKARIAACLSFAILSSMCEGFGGGDTRISTGDLSHLPIQMKEVASLHTGTTIAVAVDGTTLCILTTGAFITADLSTPEQPKLMGQLPLVGGRQVVIANHIAYVSARDPGKGVYIIDITQPKTPRLLCHYDADVSGNTTGIAISGNILAIAGTSLGMELVDVSNPRQPEFLSTTFVGEVQSVAIRNGYVYAPIHRAMELVIVDARIPRQPKIIARAPLDGFADGVRVAGDYCYIATGHHSRTTFGKPQEAVSPGEAGWGEGRGLEIFDISTPARPRFCGRVKFPRFFIHGPDWWGVEIAGKYGVVADGINGVLVVDITNPAAPTIVAQNKYTLPVPWKTRITKGEDPSLVSNTYDYTSSIAVIKGYVIAANLWGNKRTDTAPKGGVSILAAPEIEHAPQPWDTARVSVGTRAKKPDARIVYQPPFNIRSVDFIGNTMVVGAGNGGIQLIDATTMKLLNQYPSEDIVMNVRVSGDLVIAAEAGSGLSIYRNTGAGSLALLGRYRSTSGAPVVDVAVPPPGKYALLECGGLEIVDISSPARISLKLRDLGTYAFRMYDQLVDKRYALASHNNFPYYRYDLYGGPVPRKNGSAYEGSTWNSSVAMLDNGQLLIGTHLNYRLVDDAAHRIGSEKDNKLPRIAIPGDYGLGNGRCRYQRCDQNVYIVDDIKKKVFIASIANPQAPRMLDSFDVEGRPGRIQVHNGQVYIPLGYAGVFRMPVPKL